MKSLFNTFSFREGPTLVLKYVNMSFWLRIMIILHRVQEYTLQVHKSLLVGDFRSAAEISLHAHNISDALMIAIAGGFDCISQINSFSVNNCLFKRPELVRHVQAQYFARTTSR